jgi:hypothetical protein
VTDAQYVDGVRNTDRTVEIHAEHEIGDVPMHEQLAGPKTDDLVRRHSTVRTANPQMPWRLLADQSLEKMGIVPDHAVSPATIVLEEIRERRHAPMLPAIAAPTDASRSSCERPPSCAHSAPEC